MRFNRLGALLVLPWALLCALAEAGVVNDVPSCYAMSKVGIDPPQPRLELFVLIDQTTSLDEHLQAAVRENVSSLIHHGNAFTVATFSSFSQGHYLEVVTTGYVEATVPEPQRDDISVHRLEDFDVCMAKQEGFARRKVAEAIQTALQGASESLDKSEILGSLKEFAVKVRDSKASEKVLLLVSDTLENSATSSFYSHGGVRHLDAAAELQKVEQAGLFSDFRGTRVYVLGAGLVAEDSGKKAATAKVYRDAATLTALQNFWAAYFKRSNADLREFGTPALLVPVR